MVVLHTGAVSDHGHRSLYHPRLAAATAAAAAVAVRADGSGRCRHTCAVTQGPRSAASGGRATSGTGPAGTRRRRDPHQTPPAVTVGQWRAPLPAEVELRSVESVSVSERRCPGGCWVLVAAGYSLVVSGFWCLTAEKFASQEDVWWL